MHEFIVKQPIQGMGLRLLLCLFLSCTTYSCSWTPEVRTSLYENEEGSVSFITVPDSQSYASHPSELPLPTMTRVLQGLYRQPHTGLLQGLFADTPSKERLFSEGQVSWLAPALCQAFSRVTPEELVNFRLHPSGSDFLKIVGSMALEGEYLVVSIHWESRTTQSASKPNPAVHSRNPAGILEERVLFLPEEAVKKDISRSWLAGPDKPNQVIINYSMLTNNSPQSPAQSKTIENTPAAHEPALTPAPANLTPHTTPHDSLPPSAPSTRHTPEQQDGQNLLEELKKLRQQLEEQQAEIEALKNR